MYYDYSCKASTYSILTAYYLHIIIKLHILICMNYYGLYTHIRICMNYYGLYTHILICMNYYGLYTHILIGMNYGLYTHILICLNYGLNLKNLNGLEKWVTQRSMYKTKPSWLIFPNCMLSILISTKLCIKLNEVENKLVSLRLNRS